MIKQNKIYRLALRKDAEKIVLFQQAMAWETEKIKLDEIILNCGVNAVFDAPHLGQYYVCECDDEVVASLMITTEWSDWRNGTVWWIQSVYVKPELRGQGLFSGMYDYIQTLVKADKNVRGLRLYVDKTNKKAQTVYLKVGMNGEHYQLFEWMKTF